MKKLFTTVSILFAIQILYCQNVGINTTGAVGADCSILDLSSTTTGLLVPRMSIANTGAIAPITGTPVEGLIVFNTNAAIAGTGAAGVGYYYWSITAGRWINLIDNVAPGGAWMLAGNAGTNAAADYVGTTDGVDLVLRTVGVERMRILGTGNVGFVGIGINPPEIGRASCRERV